MWLENIEALSEFNIVSVSVRLVLALLLGGLLGLERERQRRPAGLRTYVLVCLGATLSCLVNIYLGRIYTGIDPARIPAQVISGIGFLGAGTIIVTRKQKIKGLTTAAGLWCCAAIGIAVGSGFYSGAIISTIIVVGTLQLLLYVDRRMELKSNILHLYLEYESNPLIKELAAYAKKNGYKLIELELLSEKNDRIGAMTFSLILPSGDEKEKVIRELMEIPGCIMVDLLY